MDGHRHDRFVSLTLLVVAIAVVRIVSPGLR